jgi:pheromone shutdown-related protein TraB
MSDTRMTVNFGDREIILIGTAHVSKESIDEVRQVIRGETPLVSGSSPGDSPPDQVCVELDAARYTAMTQKESWEKLDVIKVFREGKGFLLMANLVLSGFQRRMGKELGVQPGEEMKTAVETAEAMGIPYAFCDREVQITLRRAWARCGFWSKCKLLASLLSSAFTTEKLSETEIENLKNRSELDGMMTELAEYLPSVKETLIDERDRYLAAKIWASAAQVSVPVRRQVAVVGAGHLQGIKAHLERIASGEESGDVVYLDQIPPPSFFSKAAGWIFPALILAIIVAGFFRAGADMSLAMVLRWILWNGSLAAAGTLIALGHPLSILVSFIGAPFATLNPVLGIGLFSGITEASMRKPRVIDAETITDDISSLRGVYRNRITKALLVFFLSSIGGAVGNFISIPSLAELLVK